MKERKKNFIDHHGKMPHQVPKDLEAVYFYDCWIGYFPSYFVKPETIDFWAFPHINSY